MYSNNQQPQPYANQPYPMAPQPPMQPVMGVPAAPLLWPNGIGITFTKQKEGECASQPCACCALPFWYTDQQRSFMSKESRMKYGLCSNTAWEVENGDAMGVPLSLKGETSCTAQCGGHDIVHVAEGGRPIGHVKLYYPCCSCTHQVLTEAFDAAGNSRFTRHDNPCTRSNYLLQSAGCCDYWEVQYPINGPATTAASVPLTYMINRVHPCAGCYPTWTGFRQWPMCVTTDDQKLLLAMVHARLWRTESEQQSQGSGGSA